MGPTSPHSELCFPYGSVGPSTCPTVEKGQRERG